MKAILLLQTVSISKILDVETDNVATAGSSEMRRGGKEKFLGGKKLYKAIKLFPISIKRSTITPAFSATAEKSSHRQRSCSEGKIRVGP